MKLTVSINGHHIGELAYDLPRDKAGKTVAVPRAGHDPGEVTVRVKDDDGHDWIGVAELVDCS